MIRLKDLINKSLLNELEFTTQKSFDVYKKQHDLRDDTKVTIAGKETTAGEASKKPTGMLQRLGAKLFGKTNPDEKEYKLKTGEPITVKILRHTNYNGYTALEIGAFYKDKKIGSTTFNSDETNDAKKLTSSDTTVKQDFRKKGVASAMYNFTNGLGYNVIPSSNQTPDGKAFTKGYKKTDKDD